MKVADIIDSSVFPSDVDKVIEYFEKQWIRSRCEQNLKETRIFPPSLRNVYDATLDGAPPPYQKRRQRMA